MSDSLVSPSEEILIISDAIHDEDYINLITPIYQDYLDGQSKIPIYIHPGGDYQQVGFTTYPLGKIEWTIDSSFYYEFIVNLFNRIDNLIEIDFEIWDHYDGTLIDIYATEYNPYDSLLGASYAWDGYVDIEFRVLDDVRENYITIVHEVGHALGLDHPDGDGYNSNYDIQDTIMSYNGNSLLEEIWFSDADIYTLQRIYGLEENTINNSNGSFSISGTVAAGNTLSINEDTASITVISINENSTLVDTFSSNESVTWSISGGLDKSLFSINYSNGALSFNTSPDYESPSDSNADNRYIVDVRATNSSGDTSDKTVFVSVNDVIDTVPVVPISLTVEQKFGSSSSDTISTSWDELVWGLDGDDTFILPTYTNSDIDIEPFLIGGNGNDTFTINKNQGALIYEAPNQGDNDLLVINNLSFNSSDSYYIFLDERHILFGNIPNNQYVFVLDALDSLNYPYQSGIDYIQLDDALYDANTLISSLYYQRYLYGGYLGSYSFSYVDQLLEGLASQEGWTTSNLGNLISEINNNEASFMPDNSDIWNYLASNTDLIEVFGSDTIAALNHYLSSGAKEERVADNFDEWAYLASNPELIDLLGSDANAATKHYVTNGYLEGRNTSGFNPSNYLSNYSDLSAVFDKDLFLATKHYVEFGYAEGRTDTSTSSNSSSDSGSISNLTDLEAYNYIASNNDLISAFGIDIGAAKVHYENYGISEGRSLDSFSASNYLTKYSDLSAAFGDDQTLALKHYIEFGYTEGRTDTFTSSNSSSDSGGSSNLTDFEAYNYIASYDDLIIAFGTDLTSAKSHYANYGKSEGRPLDTFDEWGYLASNNDLMNAFGSDTTEAVKHYISFGKSEGRSTNIFNADSYLNNYADLRNAFGTNEELATKHYVEYGFNEGRVF